MLCVKCKERMAIVYITQLVNNQPVNEGYCMKCAKELNLPQVDNIMNGMGISPEDIDDMNSQMMEMFDSEGFEPGGAETMPPFLSRIFGGDNTPIKPQNPSEEKQKKPKKNEKKEQKNKFLDNYCTNLTARAREGLLDNIIGRDKEIYRVTQILNRRIKNNPCLIGEPGVGKTAIAEGIAQKIVSGDAPFRLQSKELYLLDMTALVAGTQFRGQFESRLKGLINEVKELGNVILFIDEVHTLVGTGDSEGSMSAANILKPSLSRGEIQVIGATTFNEYRKHIENDAALERRFQPVTVNEPTIDEAVTILSGVKSYYEDYHKVKVPAAVISGAVTLSERYITDRYLPDKAIDLLDEACSCRSLASRELVEYEQLNGSLKVLYGEEEALEQELENPDYEKIASVKSEIVRVKDRLKALEQVVANIEVGFDDLAKVIELWTGIPAAKIKQDELRKIVDLESALKKRIIGQDEACELVAAAMRRNRVQISKRRRPASFIFTGPTGVGKTELVKVLSQELFDTVDPLIRLDMSEFMEKHAVSRLIGSPPGYVGYDEAGQLTEKVRRRPYSVILFDEIEKAHPDVMNLLLQILDEGKVTDAHGRNVNFENTVICMTSNAGSNEKVGIAGFNKGAEMVVKDKSMKALLEFLRPEFLSRVDEVVVFKPLDEDSLEKIAALMLDELKEPMNDKGIMLGYDSSALKLLVKKAQGGKFAARDLRRVIRKEVEDRLASLLVERLDNPPVSLLVTSDGEDIKLEEK